MSPLRLTCHVSATSDEGLPHDDAHPFHVALDDLADAIAASLVARGVDPDTIAAVEVSEHGSLLTMSSDAPAWAAYFWIYLPEDAAAQATLLPTILDHLSRAKEAVPDAIWQAKLGETALVWDAGRFHLPA